MNQDGAPLAKLIELELMTVIDKYSGQGLTVGELIGILEGIKFSVMLHYTIEIDTQEKGERNDT